jgi:transposase
MWQSHRRQAEPDCAAVHRELKRKHVALSILWEEYITGEPGRVSYSRLRALPPLAVDDSQLRGHQ